MTSLQYILIWENNNLLNKELLQNVIYYKGLVIYFIIINYENYNHINILIFNNPIKLCYRFDPYGKLYNDDYNINNLNNILYKYCQKIKYNYLYYDNVIGVQQYEKKNKLYINDLNGYCLVWCILFAEYYINNKTLSLNYFIDNFNKLFNNEEYYNIKLKEKQNELSKIRDIILTTLNISINDYYNDITDINIIKKMFSELNNIINKYTNNI